MFQGLWAFLGNEKNRQVLSYVGGAVCIVVASAWGVFQYLYPPNRVSPPEKPTNTTSNSTAREQVTQTQFEKCFYRNRNSYRPPYQDMAAAGELVKLLTSAPYIIAWTGGTLQSAEGYSITNALQSDRYISIFYAHDDGVLQVAPYDESMTTVRSTRYLGAWIQKSGTGCVWFQLWSDPSELRGVWSYSDNPEREYVIYLQKRR